MPAGHQTLDAGALAAFLAGEGVAWRLVDGRLHRELAFPSFADAFGFMAAIALVAERLDHHPTWTNSYRRVTIDLVTHVTGGVSALDLELAREIDARAPAAAA